MARIINLIIFLVVLTIGLAFAALNAEPVEIDYYFGSWRLSLSLVIVFSLLVGVLAGIIASLGFVFRLKREISALRKSGKLAEEELANLRALPVRDNRP
ncbi:MAG: LapA family protein [Gammaproteobacteria bacterium]|nr:LapA family protein [Gammaproteobacteria bacterium]